MITIKGEYNEAVVYTDVLEESARGILQTFCDQEFLKDSKIRVMPDVHAGKGCTIGTTMTITDAVIPNAVGVDIGCGVLTVKLKDKRINLPELDSFIRKNIPCGFAIRERPHRGHGRLDFEELRCLHKVDNHLFKESLSTLGGGNHYIECDKDSEGNIYLQIHTGSRNPGLQVANYYQKKAYEALGGKSQASVSFDLAYVQGQLFDNYINDMKFMQKFAAMNRRCIADDIIEGLNLHEDSRFDTIHNYIDTDNMILRKGAVASYKDELLIIPMNMRDGSLICKGNPDWNYSAPHGAGRLMSRTEAFNSISLTDFKKSMEGIFTTSVDKDTIDEAPMVYKPMEEIIKYIEPTVEIVNHIKPIYNFKAGDESPRRRKGKE